MLHAKEFKALIGFDHTKSILLFILTSGLAFPYIFLPDRMAHIDMLNPLISIVIGLSYASVVTIGNVYLFYYLKTRKNKPLDIEIAQKQITRNLFYHFIYTITAATLMLAIPGIILGDDPLATSEIIRNMVGACLLVAIWIGFYETAYYMNALNDSIKKQEQLQRENVESQLEILKNQVKPHFLFNSLNTLASLIPEDAELAVDYVQKLSKVYRYVLEIKDKKLIPIAEELQCIKAYLFMLQIRFGENLKYTIDEQGLNPSDHIVPLSLQLLIENAVKHNIISSKKPLNIRIAPEGNKLVVSNNIQPKIQVEKSTGTGLANINSRYEILTDRKVVIQQSDLDFIVKLPILKVD